VGKINNTGLIEVPMGVTLREIIYEIGGGIPGNKRFKAVQTGGPSGGCIPSSHIDLPIDYENLKEVGSMMGSGGMIVMDEDTCMVDVSKFFIQFTNDESCGKCTACRDGSDALLEVLTRISDGEGREGDVEFLEELGQAVKDASMCGLGQTLPNPVLSTLRYFRDEYEAHIKEKRCPAKACKNLIAYWIDPQLCQACLICMRECPAESIYGEKHMVHVIDQTKCTKCGTCLDVCPPHFGAVKKLSGEPVPPVEHGIKVVRKKKTTKPPQAPMPV
jgi:NADH-quinone oxidoreductase subunit F